jgi:hypothetical protein
MSKARDIASAAPAPAGVTSTELGYVDGVTSAIQTQINTKSNIADEFSAGKNKIINGDFSINQRNFTNVTTNDAIGFDRWALSFSTGSLSYTPQTFTPGAAPVAGYEGNTYAQIAISGQSATSAYVQLYQKIEDVRNFAGQTATVSFWAKATSGTPKIATTIRQNYGTGGSPSAQVDTNYGATTLSTSWTRYSATIAIPSLTGKTLGTAANSSHVTAIFWLSAGSDFNGNTGSIGINNSTIQIWGVQVEAGSVATPFETATGTKQGELAACQRYYWRTALPSAEAPIGAGAANATTTCFINVNHPVSMRVAPTAIDYSGIFVSDLVSGFTTFTNFTINQAQTNTSSLYGIGFTGLTQYRGLYLRTTTTAGYLGLSAEL